jgi:hypothetical protein
MRSKRILALAVTATVLFLCGPALAGSYADFTLNVGEMGAEDLVTFADLAAASESIVLPDDNGGTAVLMNGSIGTDNWNFSWDMIEFNPDPFVNLVGSFTNNTGSTQNFTFTLSTAVGALGATLIGGATYVTVADANFDGTATLQNITGMPGYSGTLDGVNALDLLAPFSISAPFQGGVAGTNVSLGLPGPTIPAGAVVSTIGIVHRFSLTAGDTATFNSTFQVIDAIPEPTTGLLLGLGLCGIALQRRRAA